MKTRHRWQPWEEEALRRAYTDSLTEDIAARLGLTLKQVYAKATALGLRKDRAFIAATARERFLQPGHGGQVTRIKPGAVPWNKGLHYAAGGRSAETRFRRGNTPHTWVPVGSYRISKDGTLERKFADVPGRSPRLHWCSEHRLVWESAHGPVPAGHVVVFRAGRRTTDPALITPDALELVTREELMRRNTVHRLPREVAQAVQLIGALRRQLNQRAKDVAA
jgi:hypothetical protein